MVNIENYTEIAFLFPRLLGFIYFFAFGAFLFQIKGLIGKNGILPVADFLVLIKTYYPKKRLLICPSLFWINCSDFALMMIPALGTFLSLLLMLGVAPSFLLFVLFVLYLSIESVGQDFLSFGWEGFLLEITLNAFLLSLTPVPNLMVWISLNLLLFRFHFQAGVSKLLSRDGSWRDLMAIAYHYQTQPLPNMIAWYAYRLPLWIQKGSVILMFFIELILPFAIFGSESMRLFVFVGFAGLQFFIWFTGNFSFLNHLTLIFCAILLNNAFLASLFEISPVQGSPQEPLNAILNISLTVVGSVLTALQLLQQWEYFFSYQRFRKLFYWLSALHIINRYGIFAVMTTVRYEIVIEGSHDGIAWEEYSFKYKPSEVTRRPGRISPYQPRIDWQAWFLPFTTFHSADWFQKFLIHLLKGTPEVVRLLRKNPFEEKPPRYIRAMTYEYVFSTPEEKKKFGWWWRRMPVEQYSPILSLRKEEYT